MASRVIIVGIGSQAEVIQSILEEGEFKVAFASFGNDVSSCHLQPYLGRVRDVVPEEGDSFIVAVGDNFQRMNVVKEVLQYHPGATFTNAISSSSRLMPGIKIGVGNVICPGVMVQTGSIIGDHTILNTNSSIDHHCDVRSYVHIAPNCALCGHTTLHEGVFLGVGSAVTPKVSVRPWAFLKAQSLIKSSTIPIPIYDVVLKSKVCVQDALDSGWISSRGKYIDLAQKQLQELYQVKHALLTSNGTCATHCLFIALKYAHPSVKKIYVPDNVYVAVWNSVLYEYPLDAIEVMKMDERTLNIDTSEEYWKTLEPSSCVVIVHNVGNVVNVPRLKRLRPDIIFVEDACEAFGGSYESLPAGSVSFCSSVSFFANKTLTGGELGCVLTNDSDIHKYLSRKINQGVTETRYIHDILAYNYRATNLSAGLLCDQLLDREYILREKQRIFDLYQNTFPRNCEAETTPANWIMPIHLPGNPSYEECEKFFKSKGIEIRPMFYPINCHEHLKSISNDTSVAKKIHREHIMVPSHPTLTDKEVLYIISCLKEWISLYTLEK
jgi:perosamine synthetase